MFAGRWIVISGASSGIGEATAHRLLEQDARLVLYGRNEEKLQAFKTENKDSIEVIASDLSDLESIRPNIFAAVKNTGPIYGLCHSAGVFEMKPFSSTSPELLTKMLQINLFAGLELARTIAHRQVMDPKGGSLVLIASICSELGAAGQTAYAASKGALVPAVKSIALELAQRKIRANLVSPGHIETAMSAKLSNKLREAILQKHPLGFGKPDDIARAVSFLLSPENPWVTGSNLIVDGGYSAL